jgi:hypothetical protein
MAGKCSEGARQLRAAIEADRLLCDGNFTGMAQTVSESHLPPSSSADSRWWKAASLVVSPANEIACDSTALQKRLEGSRKLARVSHPRAPVIPGIEDRNTDRWVLTEKANGGPRASCFGLWQEVGEAAGFADLVMEPDVARGQMSRSKPAPKFSDRA